MFKELDLIALNTQIPLDRIWDVPAGSPLLNAGNSMDGLRPGDVGTIVYVQGRWRSLRSGIPGTRRLHGSHCHRPTLAGPLGYQRRPRQLSVLEKVASLTSALLIPYVIDNHAHLPAEANSVDRAQPFRQVLCLIIICRKARG